MGDGHHGWAAADFLTFVRTMLVRDLPDGRTALLSLLPPRWHGTDVEVHGAPVDGGKSPPKEHASCGYRGSGRSGLPVAHPSGMNLPASPGMCNGTARGWFRGVHGGIHSTVQTPEPPEEAMMLDSPADLFVYELSAMYDAETKASQFFGEVVGQIQDTDRAGFLRAQEQQSRQKIRNLDECFQALDTQRQDVSCAAVDGMRKEW